MRSEMWATSSFGERRLANAHCRSIWVLSRIMHISKVLRVFTCTYVEILWKFRVAATGQCPAIANFQGNFRNFTFSGARKFPVAFLEIYVWPKPVCVLTHGAPY